ncbi:hypothetical protein [Actinocorallia sp. A-T 12471]|uniref:hypothetical protein n=1 Tax=Actinocorallia sp. A-T 12471 TaxID=3089813 RepID=UPI0029D1ED54|nr:hypothetical protein [Actinocorallia sp. A-T 12471]MDX6741324.1 hypothetical protein [Actinocorallia sp. A-T 12471]
MSLRSILTTITLLAATTAGCSELIPTPDPSPPPAPPAYGFSPPPTIQAPSGTWLLDPTADPAEAEFYLHALPKDLRTALTYETIAIYRPQNQPDTTTLQGTTIFLGGILPQHPQTTTTELQATATKFGLDPLPVTHPDLTASAFCLPSYTEDPNVTCFWADGRSLGMLTRPGTPTPTPLKSDLTPFYTTLTKTLP